MKKMEIATRLRLHYLYEIQCPYCKETIEFEYEGDGVYDCYNCEREFEITT